MYIITLLQVSMLNKFIHTSWALALPWAITGLQTRILELVSICLVTLHSHMFLMVGKISEAEFTYGIFHSRITKEGRYITIFGLQYHERRDKYSLYNLE